MADKKNPSDSVEYTANSEMIPTKELLRSGRKRDYEKAKAARKAQRAADKDRKNQMRVEERLERDKSLWAALKRGSDIIDGE